MKLPLGAEMLGESGLENVIFALLRRLNRPVKFSCTDFVDMTGQNLCSTCSVHTGGRWLQIKRLGYAPPRNWDASGARKASAWKALIL